MSLSDGGAGGAFSPTSLSWSGTSTAQTFTYTPSSAGAKTITPTASPTVTGGVSPTTLTYTATSGSTTVSLSTANCLFAPYVFDSNLKSVNEGSYLKTNFTNGSTANITLGVDTSLFSGLSDSIKPYLEWSIDSGPVQNLQLTAANTSGGFITLASSLAAATHSLMVVYRSATPFQDHWTPVVNFTPTSLIASTGTLALTQPTALPNNFISFGDSITAAEGTEGLIYSGSQASYATNSDALHGWVPAVAKALNSEYAQVGFGGQGWNNGAADGVTPSFPNTYGYIYSGHARSYAVPPKYAIINHGTNGNTVGSAGTVSGVLSGLRGAVGSGTKIFLLIPFNGSVRSTSPSLITEFQSYQGGSGNVTSKTLDGMTVYSGSADLNTFLVDLGAQAQIGLVLPAATNTGGSLTSYDTTHPSAYGNIGLAALVGKGIEFALSGTASGGGLLTNPGMSGGIRN